MIEHSEGVRRNIYSVWSRVDDIDRAEGMVAYPRLHSVLQLLADRYHLPLASVTGAFSALSPNNDYSGNLRSLVTLLQGQRDSAPLDSLSISTYNACRDRAWAYLHGVDFLKLTKGSKTRAFYQNILDPTDPVPVTIDGHMVCVSLAKRMTMVSVVRAGFNYLALAHEFREVACDLGILPNQLQAILWFTWKRIHRVIYNPQLDVFRAGDQWGYLAHAMDVKPFPPKQRARPMAPTDTPEPNFTLGLDDTDATHSPRKETP